MSECVAWCGVVCEKSGANKTCGRNQRKKRER